MNGKNLFDCGKSIIDSFESNNLDNIVSAIEINEYTLDQLKQHCIYSFNNSITLRHSMIPIIVNNSLCNCQIKYIYKE